MRCFRLSPRHEGVLGNDRLSLQTSQKENNALGSFFLIQWKMESEVSELELDQESETKIRVSEVIHCHLHYKSPHPVYANGA